MVKTKKNSEKRKLVNFKATKEERDNLKKNARIYSGGNVGALIKMIAASPRLQKTNRIRVSVLTKRAA